MALTYTQAYDFIEKAAGYGSVLGLDSITNLLSELGNPQDQLKFVHIGGTNGKGSTAAFITHILAAGGYQVGRYISPSVFSYEEKIQITYLNELCKKQPCGNDVMERHLQSQNHQESNIQTDYIKEAEIASYIERIQQVCQKLVACNKAHPTVFEIETAMAMLHFLHKGCDIVVLEVGLGGKLDATNVIKTAECGVITSISMDHMEYLGDTLEKIALQKAGIIKPGMTVISYDQKPEAMKVISETAKAENVALYQADFEQIKSIEMTLEMTKFGYKQRNDLIIKIPGKNQVYNAVVAILTAEELIRRGYNITEESIQRGLRETSWPGRFEVIQHKPLFIIDGAHNLDAALFLVENIKHYLSNRKVYFIMGVLKDKDYSGILETIKGVGETVFTITPNNSRALPSDILANTAKEKGIQVVDAKNINTALQLVLKQVKEEDVIIAFGSLSYLFDVVSQLHRIPHIRD